MFFFFFFFFVVVYNALSSCVTCNSFIQNLVASDSAVSSLLLDSKIIISVCNVVSSFSALPPLISGKRFSRPSNFCSASSFFDDISSMSSRSGRSSLSYLPSLISGKA